MNDDHRSSAMSGLNLARAPFMRMFDEFWRRERLYRYVYWLNKREHPSFNLLGSWTEADISSEIRLWREISDTCFTDEEVETALTKLLESRFDMPWDEALQIGEMPQLAAHGLPVWNAHSGCLLPQNFGNCRISTVYDHAQQTPGVNMGYAYRNQETPEALDVYIYGAQEGGLLTGFSDERLVVEMNSSWEAILYRMSHLQGYKIESHSQMKVEAVRNPYSGASAELLTIDFVFSNPAEERTWSTLSLCPLHGRFAKFRYTAPQAFIKSPEGSSALAELNASEAEFIGMFG